jgi:hypothetical protein
MRAFTELRAMQGKRFQSTPEPEFTAIVEEEPKPPAAGLDDPVPDPEQEPIEEEDGEAVLRNEPKLILPLETYFVPPAYPENPVEPGPPTAETGGNPSESQPAL